MSESPPSSGPPASGTGDPISLVMSFQMPSIRATALARSTSSAAGALLHWIQTWNGDFRLASDRVLVAVATVPSGQAEPVVPGVAGRAPCAVARPLWLK